MVGDDRGVSHLDEPRTDVRGPQAPTSDPSICATHCRNGACFDELVTWDGTDSASKGSPFR